jgi:hypothetical protein
VSFHRNTLLSLANPLLFHCYRVPHPRFVLLHSSPCRREDVSLDPPFCRRFQRPPGIWVRIKSNWIFFGSDQGGHTAAVEASWHLVSAWESTPHAWFKDVLTRIAAHPVTRLAELLPHNGKPAQA